MPTVTKSASRILLGVTAFAMIAATAATAATYQAASQGQPLSPVGDATELVELVQSNGALLWTAVGGPVTEIAVQGWPVTDGDNELGGALVIERPEDPMAGAINFGEPPMSATFEVGG